ncbi:helix-turn-helix domain-containing protein [Geodermatophilus sp. URMC 61]|uniref:helix-turn-helix domain-containing protein n=1 Tax=Geodermatophilus sp. URMC 61 TaxID=3423411 RepID=UPI00406C38E9
MQASRRDVLVHVGENLRRLRQVGGMSQTMLAEASGISRRTIINLEAGEANISLSGLDRLAEALGATFVDLVSAPAASTRSIEAVAWRGSAPESEAVLLGSVPARSEVQLWSWALGAGERYDAEPDPAGWHEMVLVTEGRLRIERDEGPVDLAAGDHATYSSAQAYAYVNVYDGVTRFIRNVVS